MSPLVRFALDLAAFLFIATVGVGLFIVALSIFSGII